MSHRVTLCSACALGRGDFPGLLAARLTDWQVVTTDCMSGCTRPSTIAFRAPGKTAYLFGEITEADLPEIEVFARAYHASPDGNFADARFLGGLRLKAMARIPG
jgi:predicted metal-binding protein